MYFLTIFQLTFSLCFSGLDTKDVSAIAIVCLFFWVWHCHWYHIQYTGAGMIYLLGVIQREMEKGTLFKDGHFRFSSVGRHCKFLISPSSPLLTPSGIYYVTLVNYCAPLRPASHSSARHPLANRCTNYKGWNWLKIRRFTVPQSISRFRFTRMTSPYRAHPTLPYLLCPPPPPHSDSLIPDSIWNPPPPWTSILGSISIPLPTSKPCWPWLTPIVTVYWEWWYFYPFLPPMICLHQPLLKIL